MGSVVGVVDLAGLLASGCFVSSTGLWCRFNWVFPASSIGLWRRFSRQTSARGPWPHARSP
jgi:hypothetical protein